MEKNIYKEWKKYKEGKKIDSGRNSGTKRYLKEWTQRKRKQKQ